MSIPTALQNQRITASEKSGGISSDPIYEMIKRVIEAKDLGGEILDYGAGVGHLSQRLLAMQRFQSVTGADLRARPSQLPANLKWICQDLNAPIPGCDCDFDVVVAAEVIEHLENPRFVMRECYRLLRPGGLVIITTPNNESWRSVLALATRGHFVAFSDSCYPAHITALLRRDFWRMFLETGFQRPEFYFTNNGGIPALPSVTWQKVSFNLLRGLRFSDNILACAYKST
jgi:2-polyprenyl-3-methyl-5-hydroxy-6-metoxy-1,4-benzoquinol methylase